MPAFAFEADPGKFKEPSLTGITLYASAVQGDKKFENAVYADNGNGYELGGRIKHGSLKTSFFLESLYKHTRVSGTNTNKTSWAFGLEHQLAKTQWLQLTLGSDIDKPSGMIFGFGYSLNFGTERTLDVKK